MILLCSVLVVAFVGFVIFILFIQLIYYLEFEIIQDDCGMQPVPRLPAKPPHHQRRNLVVLLRLNPLVALHQVTNYY